MKPDGWKFEKLKRLTSSIQYGISLASHKHNKGIKLLRISDIQNDKVEWENVPSCNCPDGEIDNYLLKSGDIVFARTGATTGKSYLVKNPDRAVFASYLIRVQCNDKISPNFLNLFFKSPMYWKEIGRDARGGTLAGFNATMLSKMTIPYPESITKQEEVVSEVENQLLEITKMRQAALKQKEAVEALQGALLREVFAYKKGDTLPSGWRWEIVDSLFNVAKEQIEPGDENYSKLPFIGLENIVSHTREYTEEEGSTIPASTCFRFNEQQVLYGKLRPYLDKVYLPERTGKCSMEILPLMPKNGYCREFIAAILQSDSVIGNTVKFSTGGRMPRADVNKLLKLKVAIPESASACNELGLKLSENLRILNSLNKKAATQLEAIEALPAAILREVFDFAAAEVA